MITLRKKTCKYNKEQAINLAMNHNNITREMAEKYTDSELKEVIAHFNSGARTFKIVADF